MAAETPSRLRAAWDRLPWWGRAGLSVLAVALVVVAAREAPRWFGALGALGGAGFLARERAARARAGADRTASDASDAHAAVRRARERASARAVLHAERDRQIAAELDALETSARDAARDRLRSEVER